MKYTAMNGDLYVEEYIQLSLHPRQEKNESTEERELEELG